MKLPVITVRSVITASRINMEGLAPLRNAGFAWTALRGTMAIAAHTTQSQVNGMGSHIATSTIGDLGTFSGPYPFSVTLDDDQWNMTGGK